MVLNNATPANNEINARKASTFDGRIAIGDHSEVTGLGETARMNLQ